MTIKMQDNAQNIPQRMIVDASGLTEVVEACRHVPVIAIDTEFARFNTYYPIVGLVQIYNGDDCFLVDPLLVDIAPLEPLLSDPDTLKVFHAGSEDMEVFQHAIGVVPSPVFDTQIGAAVLGVGFSMGYQALVEHYLEITISKEQTRSDWLARPLSEEQLSYAALDVIHLLQVYEMQAAELEGTPKQSWADVESSFLGQDIPTTIAPDTSYLKLKGLWQLDRRQLQQLKVMMAWRETVAREENKPRNRIVDQKVLLSIVREGRNSRHGFQEAGMHSSQVRKYADDLLFLQSEAAKVPEADCPDLMPRTDAPVNNKKFKRLKEVVAQRARTLEIAPELLIKRRHLEQLIRSADHEGRYSLPRDLAGWREQAIGQDLLEALGEKA